MSASLAFGLGWFCGSMAMTVLAVLILEWRTAEPQSPTQEVK